MKLHLNFISNSSSTSFIIFNKTNRDKTLVEFIEENPQLVEAFNECYNYSYNQKEMLESAKTNNVVFKPGLNEAIFGDEQGWLVGEVFDYILRDGGISESFKWRFNEYLR